MDLAVSSRTQKLLKQQMKKGGYASIEETVLAGLEYLKQQEQAGDFEPGEWDKLLAVADAEIERGDVLDGELALAARRQRRAARVKKAR